LLDAAIDLAAHRPLDGAAALTGAKALTGTIE